MRKPVLVIAALAVAAAAALVVMNSAGGPQAKAGECVAVSNRTDVVSTGCGAENARFKVGRVLADSGGNCPANDDEYVPVVPSSGGGKLCLLPNLVEGTCYRPADDEDSWGRSACTGEDTVKVAKVIPAAGIDTECPDGGDDQISIVYPEPPTTYCLSPVQKTPA
ncbi:hypothetical protein FXN61_40195 [Lentzea sp. PSKA42]|uniref:Secreted protein n=1 Tax=Lentzea indica TaxID=2604800 RepID=A0ABX1FU97_9PSEU|nr:hypothetical protein [Lentzea indica]NKE62618.1 hypothetical protein [Lentzea indica]